MKVSTIAQGTGTPGASNATNDRSAGPSRMARAKAVAEGSPPPEANDPQIEKAQNDIKRIKMNTQRSVFRDLPPEEVVDSNNPDNIEQTKQASEDTKPLDPQVAEVAKIKRMAQRLAQEKDAKIKELETKLQSIDPSASKDYVQLSNLKSNPLSVLTENGITYDQLTEAILSNQSNEQNPALIKLSAEIEALKKGLEDQTKMQSERDDLQKKQVLSQMEKDASQIIATGDEYEMVRETGSLKDVIRLIDKNYETTGDVMDVEEALKLVEDELIIDSLKLAKIKKVQDRINPTPAEQPQKQDKSNVRVMRTLTNKDGAKIPSSARERAIAAFYGRNK